MSPADRADLYRLEVSRKLDPGKRGEMGQYLTPLPVARFMASLFDEMDGDMNLLDPGAGTGTLTACVVEEMCARKDKPHSIHAEVHELESLMMGYLEPTVKECMRVGKAGGIDVSGNVMQTDFIEWGVDQIDSRGSLWEKKCPQFTHCIMNPPYKRIRSDSAYRSLLRRIGVETGNLYSAFLAIGIQLLSPGGELVAIVPRSFCNGPYFKPFRNLLLKKTAIRQLHIFDSRNKAFKDDKVLQENIIFHAVKSRKQGKVVITSSSGPDFENATCRTVTFDKVVKPNNPERFIHIAVNDLDQMVVDRLSVFSCSLEEIGVEACTGPVVDFRLRSDICRQAEGGAFPLIYPGHFNGNYIQWPKPEGKKPNAIRESKQSARRLMENGWYVVTKRFSSKEERRRIVAALHTPERVPGDMVGFENHLNVFHRNKAGLEPAVAKGLLVYLNSTLLDLYFRQFSGHTQVNVTDLRSLHYPDRDILVRLGEQIAEPFPVQEEIDRILDLEIEKMTEQDNGDPLIIQRRNTGSIIYFGGSGTPQGTA